MPLEYSVLALIIFFSLKLKDEVNLKIVIVANIFLFF